MSSGTSTKTHDQITCSTSFVFWPSLMSGIEIFITSESWYVATSSKRIGLAEGWRQWDGLISLPGKTIDVGRIWNLSLKRRIFSWSFILCDGYITMLFAVTLVKSSDRCFSSTHRCVILEDYSLTFRFFVKRSQVCMWTLGVLVSCCIAWALQKRRVCHGKSWWLGGWLYCLMGRVWPRDSCGWLSWRICVSACLAGGWHARWISGSAGKQGWYIHLEGNNN